MSTKQKVYGLIATIVIVSGVFLYAVWNIGVPRQEHKASQSGLPFAGGGVPAGEHTTLLGQRGPQLQEQAQETSTSFQKLTETVLKPFTSLVLGNDTSVFIAQKQEQSASVPKPQQNQSVRPLSEEEIFDRLWPPAYREALVTVQDQMIEAGFLVSGDKVSVFTSDDDVYRVMSNLLSYAEKNNWVAPADAVKLRKGLDVDLVAAIAADREHLKTNGTVSSAVLPRNQRLDVSVSPTLVQNIIDGLKYVLSARYAEAQIPGVPGWHTIPDCYKDLAPIFPPGGPDLWSFCCNCGLLCVGPVCTFIPDCGPFSVACDVPLGCLNLMCATWPNAIWDAFWYPLGTGICGCG